MRDDEEMYLIWSNDHAAWWRAGEMGYTQLINEAGRYSKDHAKTICSQANIVCDKDDPCEIMLPVSAFQVNIAK